MRVSTTEEVELHPQQMPPLSSSRVLLQKPSPPLLLMVFFSALFSVSLSGSLVTHLPGFDGPLPFHMETGYTSLDEKNDTQMFYYFIPSERSPRDDPLVLWLTGGPGCSAFSGLVFEMGPLKFRSVKYDGTLPTLFYHPYSWTKVANIIFLDSPIGSGFSFSRQPQAYLSGDISSSKLVYIFIRKWLEEYPQFVGNSFYVAGDSFAGKVAPVIAQEIIVGNDVGNEPFINLKGYFIGNPATGMKIDHNVQVPYAHNMGILSDEVYKRTIKNCEGEEYARPSNALCASSMEVVNKFLSEVEKAHILEPKCDLASPRLIRAWRSLRDKYPELLVPPPIPKVKCRSYAYYLCYIWANDDGVRDALHVQKGTIDEWERCSTKFQYTKDIVSNLMYHFNVTSKGYRALIYSGDHDLVIPFLGTEKWIRSLNYSVVDEWRSWHVGGQVAGYTQSYQNNLTFATVKGAGHTGPEYKPKECLAMIKRWLSYQPL